MPHLTIDDNCLAEAEPHQPLQPGSEMCDGEAHAAQPATTFPRFRDLPSELRLNIWYCSFEPRVVEVHRRRPHYSDDPNIGVPDVEVVLAKCQSHSFNPVALAVCYESRAVALTHYTVSIRLGIKSTDERGEDRLDPHRRLYLSPEYDTLAILGAFNLRQTMAIMRHIAGQLHYPRNDSGIDGLKHLALCASSFSNPGYALTLVVYSRTVFQNLDQVTLFMYPEYKPPLNWSDGYCYLTDCLPYNYQHFKLGHGAELRSHDGKGWMNVGKNPLRIQELMFGRPPEKTKDPRCQ